MSNIERRYAYLDEGTFPEEGEYGVTYLTLYSSNAGNTYDGWVYDPDDKIEESLVERTYGYRNPDYPQYCWDDEVTVDLSNAQNRQESSEFEQGRITSFNTNVSSRPIILEDIDITGLTEEEREERATVVLFSAIPLVQDAYIQAHIEVQCKVNLSPDNTTGIVRVEAFYILNDESDRTMRPNPVHTFSVSSPNERHTLPWMYWNPALRHEDHNYIGVKLIATGGTVEIGISDDPDYGDAMITLASAGLTGDRIDDGRPVSLEIFGKEEVIGGYKLNPDDYTVLCTYDTGEIYEVTRICEFNPAMGTPIEQAFTTLTASYMGLTASMTIRLGMVESIELIGLNTFHNRLKLELKDYTVLAYIDTGDVMDVTAECTFSPAMGTIITSNTTLTATYAPFWMHGASFTDSINIEKLNVVATGYNTDPNDGLLYTLYEDNVVVITGNATQVIEPYMSPQTVMNETIILPDALRSYVKTSGYSLEWDAEGKISGYKSIASFSDPGGGRPLTNWYWQCKGFKGFDDVDVTSKIEGGDPSEWTSSRFIFFDFYGERDLTSAMLRWCSNVDDTEVVRQINPSTSKKEIHNMFHACEALTNLDFASTWNWPSGVTSTEYMCKHCISLKNINGLSNLDMSTVTKADYMFWYCYQLETVSGSANWDMSSLQTAIGMFLKCESLLNIDALWFWRPVSLTNLASMFGYAGCDHVSFLKDWPKSSWTNITGFINHSKIIDLDGLQGLDTTQFSNVDVSSCPELLNLNGSEDWILGPSTHVTFTHNPKLVDISALSEWDVSVMITLDSLLAYNEALTDLNPISDWDVSNIQMYGWMLSNCISLEDVSPLSGWRTISAVNMEGMFYNDDNVRYISCLSGWDVSNIGWSEVSGGVRLIFAHSNNDTPILDADALTWNVPTTAVQSGVEPLWKCSFGNSKDYQIFKGTDLPIYPSPSTYRVPLSEKLYPLPYWYYHNDVYINETL